MEMKRQDAAHHIRFYPPHHFVFYPLMGCLILASAFCVFCFPAKAWEWAAITVLFLTVTWVSYMMRQHYALTLQNRIVRLEMRLRYYELTGQRFDLLESRLSFSQLAALRFASDSELPALVERTLQENLSPTAIKKAIKNWTPDHMRV